MKRFYKTVTVEKGAILLDGRPVKTPARAPLVISIDALAEAVAQEWRDQGVDIDPQSMPFTGLSNATLDHIMPDPLSFAHGLAAFGESELLCYRAEEPFALVARQNQDWNPILGWAQTRYDVSFQLVRGIMHQPQPAETLDRLNARLFECTAFELAALNPIVTISGSLVIALAVLEGEMEPQVAFDTAHLDELWQAEQWGEDDFALQARAVRQRDFLNACDFLSLVRSSGSGHLS